MAISKVWKSKESQSKKKKKEEKKEVYPSWCAVQSKRKRGFLFLMCRTVIHK
jgi:hypothetical protein